MKKYLIVVLLLVGCSFHVKSQVTVTVNDLNVPTSPGLVILDKAPASVEKPSTPKTFGISVLNFFKQKEGAIEFTPYWFADHRNLTFMDYVKKRSPILQTLNISVAASQNDTGSYLSAGIRTHIFRFYTKSQINELERIKRNIQMVLAEDSMDEKKLKVQYDSLNEIRTAPRISMELAGALAGFSPDNNFSNLGTNRYGAWLNIRYHPVNTCPMDVLGVARYTKARNVQHTALDSSFIDAGIAAAYQRSNFDLQLEYVYRHDVDNKSSYNRLALVANYLVANNLVVVASLGKNFTEVNNIMAIFGVKFGLSGEKLRL